MDTMDVKGKEISVSERLVEDAKKELRRLTLEATAEEFDPEKVNTLVTLINQYETKATEDPRKVEKELERFRSYVDFYQEENKEIVGKAEKTEKAGKLLRFRGKGFWIAAAACLVLLLIAGSSFGEVNADENTGFFHWLKKDKTGIFAITSPKENGIEINDSEAKGYSTMEEIPEEYQQYVIKKDSISQLKEYEFQGYWCQKTSTFSMFEELFFKEEKTIKLGVTIYPDEVRIITDTFDNYNYLHTNYIGEKELDVYVKEENTGKLNYMIMFYEENRKYFVAGTEDMEILEAVSEKYMNLVLD